MCSSSAGSVDSGFISRITRSACFPVVIEAALRLNFGSEVENLANLVLSVSALGIHKGAPRRVGPTAHRIDEPVAGFGLQDRVRDPVFEP